MDKKKYIKWYRIAQEVIKDDILIPDRTDEQIMDFVSQADWLMFAPKWIITREQAQNSNNPNIWFTIDEESDKKIARIGVTFDNVPAIDKVKNILNGYCKKEKEELIKKLLMLEDVWKIKVKRKIKDKYWGERPRYEDEYEKNSNQIDDNIVDEIIRVSNRIREEGKRKREELKVKGQDYRETPAIELIEMEFKLDEQEFRKRIKDAFDVLVICLNVKTGSEIKKLGKEKKKREKIDEWAESMLEGF